MRIKDILSPDSMIMELKAKNKEDAIKEMGAIQLGMEISDSDAKKIEIFFGSLTGSKPQIIYPNLPNNGAKTPKPAF